MAKHLGRPPEIEVRANINSVPVSLARNGRWEKVIGIYGRWRIADEWWGKEVERDYFRIKTSAGLVCDIFRDTISGSWYLSKIHD